MSAQQPFENKDLYKILNVDRNASIAEGIIHSFVLRCVDFALY